MQGGRQEGLSLAFAVAFALLSLTAITVHNQKAFADGLTQETFSATLGGRNAQLLVKVNPPILTDASKNDAYMLFRLYDANTNETIKFTTFFISVEKGVGKDAVSIMNSTLFHTESGLLNLKVEPADGPIQISGTAGAIS